MKIELTVDEYLTIVNDHGLTLLSLPTTTEVVVNNQDIIKTDDIVVFHLIRHIRMWKWLSEHPDKYKKDWPGWEFNGGDIKKVNNYCFACEYAKQVKDKIDPSGYKCKYCHFGDFSNKDYLGGLYDDWNASTDSIKRKELALKIACLPIREDIKDVIN